MVLTVHNSDFASYAAVCFTLNCFNVHIRRFGYVHVHRLYICTSVELRPITQS